MSKQCLALPTKLNTCKEMYMKLALLAPILFFVPMFSSRVAMLPTPDESCPLACTPSVYEDTAAAVQGTCADVADIVLGSSSDGTAKNACATCTVCSQRATISWTCNGSCGCTYDWENRSYDAGGNAKPTDKGTGTGPGSVTQGMTTNCNGTPALFGVSVGGSKRVWRMSCGCTF